MKSTGLILRTKPLSHELQKRVRERTSKRMNEAERASNMSSTKQTNELTVRTNKQADEQMIQYSTRRFHILSTHGGLRGEWRSFSERGENNQTHLFPSLSNYSFIVYEDTAEAWFRQMACN